MVTNNTIVSSKIGNKECFEYYHHTEMLTIQRKDMLLYLDSIITQCIVVLKGHIFNCCIC